MTIRRKENRSSKIPYFFLIVLYLEKGYNQGKEEIWNKILKNEIVGISLKSKSSVLCMTLLWVKCLKIRNVQNSYSGSFLIEMIWLLIMWIVNWILKSAGRSIRTDILAHDSKNVIYNIEVQNDDAGADPKKERDTTVAFWMQISQRQEISIAN